VGAGALVPSEMLPVHRYSQQSAQVLLLLYLVKHVVVQLYSTHRDPQALIVVVQLYSTHRDPQALITCAIKALDTCGQTSGHMPSKVWSRALRTARAQCTRIVPVSTLVCDSPRRSTSLCTTSMPSRDSAMLIPSLPLLRFCHAHPLPPSSEILPCSSPPSLF
jgi:hypothetical protein